jgi:hypothetical protein
MIWLIFPVICGMYLNNFISYSEDTNLIIFEDDTAPEL